MSNENAINGLNALKRLNEELEHLDTDDIIQLTNQIIENDKQRLNASLENKED